MKCEGGLLLISQQMTIGHCIGNIGPNASGGWESWYVIFYLSAKVTDNGQRQQFLWS